MISDREEIPMALFRVFVVFVALAAVMDWIGMCIITTS